MNLKIGVYKISNLVNGKFYIGSTHRSFSSRISQHKAHLKRNIHGNRHLQRAYNKHGSDSFSYEIIEVCKRTEVLIREQYYIDTLAPQYNINKLAESCLGTKKPTRSDLHKERLREMAIARGKLPPQSKEWKEKIGKSNSFRICKNSKLKIPGLSYSKGYYTVTIDGYKGRNKDLTVAFKLWELTMNSLYPEQISVIVNGQSRFDELFKNKHLLEGL